jgi:hypothetical protein
MGVSPRNEHSLERFLITLTDARLRARKAAYANAPSIIRSGRSALDRLGDIKKETNPAYLVHCAHQDILDDLGNDRTTSDIITLATTALSELLVAWPLREKHWSEFVVQTGGRVPDQVTVETLHVDTDRTNRDGTKYTLIVPIARLKTANSNELLRKSPDSVIQWALHPRVNRVLDRYLDARSYIAAGASLFGVKEGALAVRLRSWQERHLTPALGFNARWSFHPYRSLVVVSIMQNPNIADPIGVAAATLIDSRAMTARVYGHLRPQEQNAAAKKAIYDFKANELHSFVADSVYGDRK